MLTRLLSYADALTAAIRRRGSLEIDRIGMRLPFVVRAEDEETVHVTFELDAADVNRFAQMLQHVGLQHAA